jgi:transposase
MASLAVGPVFVGIDEGDVQVQVCVVSESSEPEEQRVFAHSGTGVSEAIEWLKAKCGGRVEQIAVALEKPRGAVVRGCLEGGFQVFSINPKQLDRFRDRFTVAGSKDDRLDARVLGRSLRTDAWAFKRVRADPGWLVRMREASRLEDELKEELRRSANRLVAVLHEYHVELLALLPSADEPWFWDLVQLAATPAAGARLQPKKIQRLLTEHRIRRIGPQDVVDRLRRLPLPAGPGVIEAASGHALMLVPRLHLIAQQLGQCQAEVQKLLDGLSLEDQQSESREHRDVLILRSLPGAGRYVIATMLAEAWERLELRDYRVLRGRCGVAPVTKQSGRTTIVHMRSACNKRLRTAVHFWAWNAIRSDPILGVLYDSMRRRGLNHARALRGVGDRLLKLATVLLANGSLYDPSRRLLPA